ncbi:MAG: hypothetical protein IH948_07020, partial [Bacteroidetes bacterium]|nr:hypothetical protein [Bacteroidota bacterium]
MFRLLKIFLAITGTLLSLEVFSAEKFNVKIKWEAIQKNVISASVQHSFISFEGAQYQFDRNDLPVFYKRVSISPNQSSSWLIDKPVYVELTSEEEKLIQQEWVSEVIEVNSNIGYERGKPFALIS